jgi:hypothetical protein
MYLVTSSEVVGLAVDQKNGFMTHTARRSIWFGSIGVLLTAGYGLLLHTMTEPWRVYSNDYRFWFWTIPALAIATGSAIAAVRFSRAWFLVWLLVPLFLLSRHQIINQRLQDSIISCGNHSAFWPPLVFDANKELPTSTEFADFLMARDDSSEPIDRLLPSKRCPGFRRVGTPTGVVFVGGGLRPASLPDVEVLIAFCSWQAHPIPYDHQHCLVWWPSGGEETNGGTFHRECADATNIIARIEKALKQGDKEGVAYSEDARRLLAHELEQRRKFIKEAK